MFQVKKSRIEGKVLDRSFIVLSARVGCWWADPGIFSVFSWLVTMFVLIVSNYIYISAVCLIVAS